MAGLLAVPAPLAGTLVSDVTGDSRRITPGALFAALASDGDGADGHDYVDAALRAGAVAALVSEAYAAREASAVRPARAALVPTVSPRAAVAEAAAALYGHPGDALALVGITGTNGKTTTAHLLAAVCEAAGERVAVLGTVGCRIGDEQYRAEHTTPEASAVQRFLRRAVGAGCGVAVMESSSQALDLRRCDALHYEVAVFTNLTQDHLDYHGTMENYFEAKRRLFDGRLGARPRVSVVNVDDSYGVRLAEELRRGGELVITFALDAEADATARDVRYTLEGTRFTLQAEGVASALRSPLVGRPHIYNMLAAAACGLALGYSLDVMAAAFARCAGAPGRFERVEHAGANFAVVVDYAHTDDALRNVLGTARDVVADAGGRVVTVFGCGGDRDRTKRAPMGAVAAALSDIVILTSDNPRTEDPETILADTEVGLRAAGKPYLKLADRREAIFRAVAEASAGDVVVIAGKGHEDYQIVGTEVFHFDDREVAREALDARLGSG
ncbi:MAG TPA: UDP-N-acetylmuramoyl-L-alanyl-D-glutamate--2,6-diaminopimelate ligase [Pyrinomonadaceae bacterium]